MAPPADLVKIRFKLERGADGWPPAADEGLWAEPLGGDSYRIDNTPWFVRNLAVNDVVRALAGDDGVPWAVERIRSSGHLTVRVIPFRDGPLGGSIQAVLEKFAQLGVGCELFGQYRIAALDVPPGVALRPIKSLLRHGVDEGWWEFEEGCISDEWRSLEA